MFNAQYDVEKLDQTTLRIASAAVHPPLSLPIPFVIKYALWQPSSTHILTPGKEWSDLIIENIRIAVLMHTLQYAANFTNAASEVF